MSQNKSADTSRSNRMSLPISYPLKTLDDLENRSYFDDFHFPYNKSSVPLSSYAVRNRPRLLVCHDMKNGYLEDKWVQGSNKDDIYAIWHWHLIDIFVYFSHSLVTLPPPCWTNAAHKHGVQVLGTFITEWDEGYSVCKRLLESEDSIKMYASRLSELASVLGFDGWLINIENRMDKDDVNKLLDFVNLLTSYMHERVPGSTVIWYDSVTKDGELKWQDCLNHLNQCFFDLCDGIFTNYTWKKNDPMESAIRAGSRPYDVYMGVDVFGRNTFGGGGYQSNVALKAARDAGVSAAIFAPGWVYETDQGPTFSTAQNRWWGLVADCWPLARCYPTQIPFFSNFDQGFGKEIYLSGSKISGKPWSNISCQNLQPLLNIGLQPKHGSFESIVSEEYPVYSGGSCVHFTGSMRKQICCMTLLYKADAAVNTPLTVSYTARCQRDSRLSLLLKINDKKDVVYVLLVGPNEEVNHCELSNINILCPNNNNTENEVLGWRLREYKLEVNGKLTRISSISYFGKLNAKTMFDIIECGDSPEICAYDACLGHIAISNDANNGFNILTFECSGVSWGEVIGNRVVSLKLDWTVESLNEAKIVNYRIYVATDATIDGEFEHLGVAMVKSFYVSELPVPEGTRTLTFYLQVSCVRGVSTKLANAPCVTIQIP